MWVLVFAQTQEPSREISTLFSLLPLIILVIAWYFYNRFSRKREEERLRKIISEELRKVIDDLRTIGRTS